MEDQLTTYFNNPDDILEIYGGPGEYSLSCDNPIKVCFHDNEDKLIETIKQYKKIVLSSYEFNANLLSGFKNIVVTLSIKQEYIRTLIDSGNLIKIMLGPYSYLYKNVDFKYVKVKTNLKNLNYLILNNNTINNATIVIDNMIINHRQFCEYFERALNHVKNASIIYELQEQPSLNMFEIIEESNIKFRKFKLLSQIRKINPIQIANLKKFQHITVRHNCKLIGDLQLDTENTILTEFVTIDENNNIVKGIYKEIEDLAEYNLTTQREFRFKHTKPIYN